MAKLAFQLGERQTAGKPAHASIRHGWFRPTLRTADLSPRICQTSIRSNFIRWTAVACILLLAFAATVQVAHSHADDKAADHCQICFAIHSAMPAEAVTTGVVFTSIEQPAIELIHAAPPRFWISPFANGPPALKTAS